MSDPGTSYRTRDEIQEVRQTRDPITQFKEKITEAELVTADDLKVNKFFFKPIYFFFLSYFPFSLEN